MRMIYGAAAALAALSTTPVSATDHQRPIGQETSIPFANQHGLRDWEEGPARDVFYVQDYRNRWYQVQLSGPCIGNMASLRVAYTTGPGGAFDRFSQVFSTDLPRMTCSVISIKTSLPPPDRQEKKKTDRH